MCCVEQCACKSPVRLESAMFSASASRAIASATEICQLALAASAHCSSQQQLSAKQQHSPFSLVRMPYSRFDSRDLKAIPRRNLASATTIYFVGIEQEQSKLHAPNQW